MSKKILALCLVVILAITAVTGATLAYFTDTEKATNTMVIGNVEINIDEWQYGETGWEDYEDEEFVLYPLENEQGIALYNKSVRTYNTSPSEDDVYLRSFVLIEKNDALSADYVANNCCFPGIHYAYDNLAASRTASKDGKTHYGSKQAGTLTDTVTVGENEYWVAWFVVYDEASAIPYGAALSSLHSVYMDENIEQDDLAGWGEDGVQVIAFSQGIQAEGLTHAEAMEALGEVTVANLEKWIAGDAAEGIEAAPEATINDAEEVLKEESAEG